MIYMTLGQGIRQGLTLYKDIFDNKPLLIYLIAAGAGSLFWFKAILAFWNLGTIVAFYRLAKNKVATLIFTLLTCLPLLEGNTVNAELFLIGPIILAFYFLLFKPLTSKLLILSGFLFGIATLFKIPAIFDVGAIFAFWLITSGLKNWKGIFRKIFVVALGFLLPIIISVIWYFLVEAGREYLTAVFLQNVGYVSSWGVRLSLPQRAIFLAFAVLLLASIRKKISKEFLFTNLWLLTSLFAATLSERPYPHYLIQSAAPIAILLGMFFTKKNIEQALVVIPLALFFSVPVFYDYYHYKTGEYYLRFINFATGKITKDLYLKNFSPNTIRNYEIAKFLQMSSHQNTKVFIWDNDSPTIYALSRRLPPVRFVADYHVNDYSNRTSLALELDKNKPKFIVLTSTHPFPEIMDLIHKNYILVQQIENANIYSTLETNSF